MTAVLRSDKLRPFGKPPNNSLMCLAIPGKVESITEPDSLLRMGRISFGTIIKEASLAYVPEAQVGDYVIVHVGFALSRLNEDEARRIFDYLKRMEGLNELEEADS
jgi:hydrogenase expression/formation protein HypC